MYLQIHRGASEVGGTCIELQTCNSRLLIDFGLPLPDRNSAQFHLSSIRGKTKTELIHTGVLPHIEGLYYDDAPLFDAALISHAHPDHFGMLPYLNPRIPVYMSEGCKTLIKVGAFFHDNLSIYERMDIHTVKNKVLFRIGDFTISPLLVDHSAFDDFAFIIEAEGKRLMYTGDFRAHGRKKSLYQRLLDNPPKDIDYLFLEGTMLGRDEYLFESERAVENELTNMFKHKEGIAYITYSSQNIDRVVSIYRACIRSGCTFVIDPYSALILDRLKIISPSLPQFDWNNIRIFFTPNSYTKRMADSQLLMKFKKAKITYAEIQENRKRIVIKNTMKVREQFIKKGLLDGALLIYSVWEGYLADEQSFWNDHDVPIVKIHTSGHATIHHLKQLVRAVKPKQIIPVHTFYPEQYSELFGNNVLRLENGLQVEV